MANYTNAQKLAAVLNRWAAPLIGTLLQQNIGMMPIISNIEQKVRQSGWVSPQWSVMKELTPLMGNVTSFIIEPMLTRYLSGVPDESIPRMAHAIVDDALKKGQLSLLEGKISFDANDLTELKKYLNCNLPLGEDANGYEVKME